MGRYGHVSEFEIEVAPGAALAEVSGSSVIDATTTKMWFQATRTRKDGWIAVRIPEPSGRCVPILRNESSARRLESNDAKSGEPDDAANVA